MSAYVRGDQKAGRRGCERIPIGPALFRHRAPIEQGGGRPKRHGEDRRPEFRCRHAEREDPDHQQNGHDRVGRADHRAAERKDAPKGRDHAHLRQQIDAEHPGGAEREVREPISKRRANIRAKRRIVRDSEQVREIAGRRGIEQRRHRHPQRRLREDRKPENQPRTRAQRFDVKGDVKHRALGHSARVSVASEGRNP